MKLENFAQKSDLVNKSEIEKVAFLAYFFLQTEGKQEFDRNDIRIWFDTLNFTQPNMSRLVLGFSKSPLFTKGKQKDSFRLHAKQVIQFKTTLNWLDNISEEVVFSGAILPESVFLKTRGYIESLAKQINASYENNLFDGCAVLMRRLVEILLIHTYLHTGQEKEILSPSGQYNDLSFIIKNAISNKKINLSKGTKDCLDVFRLLGNFSAHRIEYNCKRDDIKKVALDYRAMVEELLYKSGIRV
jgi:phage antirepressor YoqD-like protein